MLRRVRFESPWSSSSRSSLEETLRLLRETLALEEEALLPRRRCDSWEDEYDVGTVEDDGNGISLLPDSWPNGMLCTRAWRRMLLRTLKLR